MEAKKHKSLQETELGVALIGLIVNLCVLAVILAMFWFMYSQLVEANFLQSFVQAVKNH